ncbi:MAG: tetratricopeptide repeat protein [Deltaproteobacteria bacterium]|nr:MAG: tetratricopeptide repeat protein [Deltaproteobacteria bacterium]
MNIERDFELDIDYEFRDGRNLASAFALLFVILIVIYGNSFDCSWHHDDFDNIVNNTYVKISDLSLSGIEKTLYGITPRDTWSRPLAYLSFAVNYYFGGLDVFGYHAVNFAIHYLATIILFLFVYETLRLPLLVERYGECAYSIALLSAVLWAIHPIQVTAVTYIVQRMAGMAALFYILAMYLHLKGRTVQTVQASVVYYFFSAVSFLLALGSKQNAAMLPVSLVMYDLFLIQGISRRSIIKTTRIMLVPACCAAVIVILYMLLNDDIMDYRYRIFGMGERLLTQPRVFFYYISQLLFPLTSRFMLLHSMDISKSMLQPWTTFTSLVGLAGILAFAMWKARRMPLISFCILFFFLNHLIEGSFLSLELIYEHRNYLPSMFFFLPSAIGLLAALDFFVRRKIVFSVIVFAVTSLIMIFGVSVWIQNTIYKDEETLWSDNVRKAPNLHTPHLYLGNHYLRQGHLPEAFGEFQIALQSELSGNIPSKYGTFMSLVYYYILVNDRDQAGFYLDEVLKKSPRRADFLNIKGILLFERNEISKAEAEIRKAISITPEETTFHSNLAKILFEKGQYDGAIKEAQKALILQPDSWKAYLLISDVYKAKGNQEAAGHFYRIGNRIKSVHQSNPILKDSLEKWDLVRASE